ncbi:MAG TPA: amidohydrolase [Flavobacteriales bacterium]|nr:amidohydrolase [Flavobacteriales bacterium]|tara:strand:+ start:112777 stop:113949 length:1173 start_codon:yes stop_codon:yes gene_type:complete
MKKITADYIFDGFRMLPEAVLILNDVGEVQELVEQPEESLRESAQYFKGIVSPGFINVHCHLELSHLYKKVPEKTGLPKFIRQIPEIREIDVEQKAEAIKNADKDMYENGIVACGDISNTADSFETKIHSNIQYHTFLEVFGSLPDIADKVMENAQKLKNEYISLFQKNGKTPKISITPHAPYSISEPLLKYLTNVCDTEEGIMSVHNQETESENEMFKAGSGELLDVLKSFGLSYDWWKPTGFNSLPSFMSRFGKCQKNILVHNTFTTQQDIEWMYKYSPENYWCFCPNANLYIEDKLPDFSVFKPYADKCVLGTDSLASNWQLNIMDEINTILKNSTVFTLPELLQMATSNGAKALNFYNLGSFEKGKKPGVVNISEKGNKYVNKRIL